MIVGNSYEGAVGCKDRQLPLFGQDIIKTMITNLQNYFVLLMCFTYVLMWIIQTNGMVEENECILPPFRLNADG